MRTCARGNNKPATTVVSRPILSNRPRVVAAPVQRTYIRVQVYIKDNILCFIVLRGKAFFFLMFLYCYLTVGRRIYNIIMRCIVNILLLPPLQYYRLSGSARRGDCDGASVGSIRRIGSL